MVVWWSGPSTNLAKKQYAILPNTRHKVHLDSCVVSVRATWHVHISPACIRPLATSGTFERCHGSMVDQALGCGEVCVRLGTCTSRQHAYAHLPRLARLKGVMVVWWTEHQLGQKTTRHTPKHTPQGASRLVCGECACDLARAHLASMHTPTRHVWHV